MKHPWKKDFADFSITYGWKSRRENNYINWKPRNRLTPSEIHKLRYNHNYLKNNPQYAKYFEEYKVHCWVPPLTVMFPEDNTLPEYDRL